MIKIDVLTFNPFQENTYILSDETGQCVIVDPGCLGGEEEAILADFIQSKGYQPVYALYTHLHLDHVFGSRFVKDRYHVVAMAHRDDLGVLSNTRNYAAMFGITMDGDPAPIDDTIEHEQVIDFGNSHLRAIHLPGHSPGSLVYHSAESNFCLSGDVLFRQSIGRTDLPGGDHEKLIQGIANRLLVLPDETIVYPGHGPTTTIGFEKQKNPFL